MIVPPSGVRVWLATGATDMQRGMNSLALQVQESLHRDPHAGDLYVFRGKRGDLLKILWHDGLGMMTDPDSPSDLSVMVDGSTPCVLSADTQGHPASVVEMARHPSTLHARLAICNRHFEFFQMFHIR